jgi:hypothetical protein
MDEAFFSLGSQVEIRQEKRFPESETKEKDKDSMRQERTKGCVVRNRRLLGFVDITDSAFMSG